MLDFRDIVKVTGGIVLQQENSDPVSFLVTDSRKAVYNPSSLFFAIRGRYHDGHDFIPALYNSGIRQFIVENNSLDFKSFPGSNFIYVPDSIHALQKITLFHRSRHKLKIIGITGSNGKTIVKEWLSQILSWKYNVVKSPKSFNSQIGVPLSVWQINENHEYGIFEAGISKAKEMEYLEKVLRPGMGIFTNIGTAHDEGFESTRQKILEKLKLFRSSELLIICSDQSEVHSLAKQELPDTRLLTWGYNNNSDIRVALQSDMAGRTRIQCRYNKRDHQFLFPYSDKASIENIMHCIALLLFLGWEESLIQEGINGLSKVSMRLELKKGINDCYIIDDTYNNDLVSLEIGLNFMANQGNKNNKTLILSDILQSGLNHKILYQKTAQLIDQYGVGKTIGIGTSVGYLGDLIKGSFKSYPDVSLFLKEFSPDTFKNEIILVKGARPYALEKIVTAFQEKIHGTVLEIDLDAVIHNFNYFRARLRPGVKIMIMVKALAYGNGMLEIANLMQYHLADYLGVAFADEGVFLRKNGIGIPVMVMNPTPDSFEKLIEFRLEPEIYSINLLHQLIPFVEKNNQVINIHLKLDTGMHRLGIGPETADELALLLREHRNIRVKSIFSHFAAADEEIYDDFTNQQARIFLEFTDKFENELDFTFIRHMANSAAIIRFPEYHYDMVRLGIGLYGLGPGKSIASSLRQVSTLKTIISQIREVKTGDTVGYGRRGNISVNSKIATIAIGYADGFSRAFGNGVGRVWVNGHIAPVIGNVCMDMTMINITGIDAREGDEVVIFGQENSLADLAVSIHTIPYEILTNISERVKRVYFKD